MAIFTFDSVKANALKKALGPKLDRKVVNIEEYRGTILLPARRDPKPAFPLSQWSPDPLNAA